MVEQRGNSDGPEDANSEDTSNKIGEASSRRAVDTHARTRPEAISSGPDEAGDSSADADLPSGRKKWPKWLTSSIPIAISILALAVSAISMVVTQRNVKSDRQIQDERRLADTIQQLSVLYGDKDSSVNSIVIFADEAAALMERVRVRPSQRLQVASALGEVGEFQRARDMVAPAVREATSASDRSVSRRVLAQIDFYLGDFEAGRIEYAEAITIAGAEFVPGWRATSQAEGHMGWARSELFQAGDCKASNEHLAMAARLIEDAPGPPPERYVKESSELKEALKARCG